MKPREAVDIFIDAFIDSLFFVGVIILILVVSGSLLTGCQSAKNITVNTGWPTCTDGSCQVPSSSEGKSTTNVYINNREVSVPVQATVPVIP